MYGAGQGISGSYIVEDGPSPSMQAKQVAAQSARLNAGTANTQRVSAVPAQLIALEQHVGALHKLIEMLTERTESVVRPATPEPVGEKNPIDPTVGVGLAERMAKSNTELRFALERLHSIVQRIEL